MWSLTDGHEAEPDEWHELLVGYLGPQELVGFIPDFECVGFRAEFIHHTMPSGSIPHIPRAETIRRAPPLTRAFEGEKSIQIARCNYCDRLIGRQYDATNKQRWASAMFHIQEMP